MYGVRVMVKIVFSLVFMVIALSVSAHIIQEDFRLYEAESKCVQKYIKLGYERRDISTGNGTCSIKG